MTCSLRITDAVSLGLHAMCLLEANSGKRVNSKAMAAALHVSEAHLSKVLNRLARERLVESFRGPAGGFELGRPGAEITLLEVYEAIDGPLDPQECLLHGRVCAGRRCILGDLLADVEDKLKKRLAETRLSDVATAFAAADVASGH